MVPGPHLGLQDFPWDVLRSNCNPDWRQRIRPLRACRLDELGHLLQGTEPDGEKATLVSQLTPPKAGIGGLGSQDLANNKQRD